MFTNPFLDPKMTEWFTTLKVPGFNPQAFLDAQRKNFEALAEAQRLAIQGADSIIKRQADLFKQTVDDAVDGLSKLMAAQSPEEKLKQQSDLALKGFKQAINNLKEISESTKQANQETLLVLQKRFQESLEEIKDHIKAA